MKELDSVPVLSESLQVDEATQEFRLLMAAESRQ